MVTKSLFKFISIVFLCPFLLQSNLQNMLEHNSPKTTEIHIITIDINNKTITSPLDTLLKSNILQT
jgi:hypothetical protein